MSARFFLWETARMLTEKYNNMTEIYNKKPITFIDFSGMKEYNVFDEYPLFRAI